MENLKEKTIAEIVAEDISKASIFKKYDIDFCCGGGKTLTAACEKGGVNADELVEELIKSTSQVSSNEDYNNWDLGVLVDHILNTHHAYIKEKNPIILQFSEKVASVHGQANPEVVEINTLFGALVSELNAHMMKEENILFPNIKKIAAGEESMFPNGSIASPIHMMEMEHDNAGDIMKRIKEISNDLVPPEHACNTYKALYHSLGEYFDDLMQHIHLENNILFPKAIAMSS
jgi:regulator of cell morphogenesis and NO signaling